MQKSPELTAEMGEKETKKRGDQRPWRQWGNDLNSKENLRAELQRQKEGGQISTKRGSEK